LPDCEGSEGSAVLDLRICGIALGVSPTDVAAATGMINNYRRRKEEIKYLHNPIGIVRL
jgi:hypothetical protein